MEFFHWHELNCVSCREPAWYLRPSVLNPRIPDGMRAAHRRSVSGSGIRSAYAAGLRSIPEHAKRVWIKGFYQARSGSCLSDHPRPASRNPAQTRFACLDEVRYRSVWVGRKLLFSWKPLFLLWKFRAILFYGIDYKWSSWLPFRSEASRMNVPTTVFLK